MRDVWRFVVFAITLIVVNSRLDKKRMPKRLCQLCLENSKNILTSGVSQHEIQAQALRRYLWETAPNKYHDKIPEETVNWIKSVDRELYTIASDQSGRKKRQTRWFKSERKEIRMLSDEERQEFFNCLQTLKDDRSIRPNVYDSLARIHQGGTIPAAHYGPAFLPFHRVYLLRLEVLMRRYCGPRISLPYWDSSLDQPLEDPAISVLWSPTFLGNAFNDVVEGPFANWTDYRGAPLRRNLNIFGSQISKDEIERVVDRAARQSDLMIHDSNVELISTIEGIHNNVHAFVGGTMNGLNSAPGDPAFYLHHAFIDYLWERARRRLGSSGQNMVEYPITSNDLQRADRPMSNFTFFRNQDGFSPVWTRYFFDYADPPTCSRRRRNCGSRYLICDRTSGQPRCRSTTTNYVFDVSPEVRLASALKDLQTDIGPRFQTVGNLGGNARLNELRERVGAIDRARQNAQTGPEAVAPADLTSVMSPTEMLATLSAQTPGSAQINPTSAPVVQGPKPPDVQPPINVQMPPSQPITVEVKPDIPSVVKVQPSHSASVQVKADVPSNIKENPSQPMNVHVKPGVPHEIKIQPALPANIQLQPDISPAIQVQPHQTEKPVMPVSPPRSPFTQTVEANQNGQLHTASSLTASIGPRPPPYSPAPNTGHQSNPNKTPDINPVSLSKSHMNPDPMQTPNGPQPPYQEPRSGSNSNPNASPNLRINPFQNPSMTDPIHPQSTAGKIGPEPPQQPEIGTHGSPKVHVNPVQQPHTGPPYQQKAPSVDTMPTSSPTEPVANPGGGPYQPEPAVKTVGTSPPPVKTVSTKGTPTPTEPTMKPKPSIISNLNLPSSPRRHTFTQKSFPRRFSFKGWRTRNRNPVFRPQHTGRGKRSVGYPTPVQEQGTSWVHEMAYTIQNDFEIDGVRDVKNWVFLPVKIIHMRPPNRHFDIKAIKNGTYLAADIYDPTSTPRLQRHLRTQDLPARSQSSVSGSGATKIYVRSDGLSYSGTYTDYAIADQRMPISELVAFVAIRDPQTGKSESHISVFDSTGNICKPRCARSKSRTRPKYRPCSGVVEATTSSPDYHYSSTLGEAILEQWSFKDDFMPKVYREPYLAFVCDCQQTLYWQGCENDKYQ